MQRILVPIGVRHPVQHILPAVAALARRLGAGVHLLHGLNPLDLKHYGDPSLFPDLEDFDRHARTISERTLERLRHAPALRGLEVATSIVETRDPVALIVDTAAELGAEWIAMPSRMKASGDHWVPGSVTASVIERTPLPVVLFAATRDARDTHLAFDRVLMPTDGSAAAEVVAPQVLKIAGALEAEVDVLHVVEDPGSDAKDRKRLRAALTRRVQRLLPGVTAHVHVLEGAPGHVISLFAETYGSDLVVMASHGRDHAGSDTIGEHAEHVIRHTSCPVCML